MARSSLPSASISARLQSIMPAPVFSRSALIAAAFTSAMIYLLIPALQKCAAWRSSACFLRLRSPIIGIAVFFNLQPQPPHFRSESRTATSFRSILVQQVATLRQQFPIRHLLRPLSQALDSPSHFPSKLSRLPVAVPQSVFLQRRRLQSASAGLP